MQVGSYLTASGEGGLEINEGRPDTHALLLAAEQGRDGATIGVFVGGERHKLRWMPAAHGKQDDVVSLRELWSSHALQARRP